MNKVLITGSTGFVGQALTHLLTRQGRSITASVRVPSQVLPDSVSQTEVGDISPSTTWTKALTNVEVVIHLAARVHVMKDSSADPLEAFRQTNTLGTINLAKQASASGVRRFIFLSSIKVNGEFTHTGKPFKPEVASAPTDPYGLSKYEAEQGLLKVAKETGMEVVIIRPPLVYGPGVKGNFLQMMRWVSKGIPLPLGAMQSERSLVALDNLTSLISVCVNHPAAAGETFLVSDDKDVTTTYLLKQIGKAVGKPARLLPIPQGLLALALKGLGQSGISQRLCSSLQVDISKTKTLLGWKPVVDMDDTLDKTAKAWLKKQS